MFFLALLEGVAEIAMNIAVSSLIVAASKAASKMTEN